MFFRSAPEESCRHGLRHSDRSQVHRRDKGFYRLPLPRASSLRSILHNSGQPICEVTNHLRVDEILIDAVSSTVRPVEASMTFRLLAFG